MFRYSFVKTWPKKLHTSKTRFIFTIIITIVKNDEGSKRRIESLKKCIIYDLGVISLASLDDQAIYNELNRVSLLF